VRKEKDGEEKSVVQQWGGEEEGGLVPGCSHIYAEVSRPAHIEKTSLQMVEGKLGEPVWFRCCIFEKRAGYKTN